MSARPDPPRLYAATATASLAAASAAPASATASLAVAVATASLAVATTALAVATTALAVTTAAAPASGAAALATAAALAATLRTERPVRWRWWRWWGRGCLRRHRAGSRPTTGRRRERAPVSPPPPSPRQAARANRGRHCSRLVQRRPQLHLRLHRSVPRRAPLSQPTHSGMGTGARGECHRSRRCQGSAIARAAESSRPTPLQEARLLPTRTEDDVREGRVHSIGAWARRRATRREGGSCCQRVVGHRRASRFDDGRTGGEADD